MVEVGARINCKKCTESLSNTRDSCMFIHNSLNNHSDFPPGPAAIETHNGIGTRIKPTYDPGHQLPTRTLGTLRRDDPRSNVASESANRYAGHASFFREISEWDRLDWGGGRMLVGNGRKEVDEGRAL